MPDSLENPVEMRIGGEEENPDVELIVTRGTFCKGFGNVRPGDTISVPAKFQRDGVPPVRWWEYHKKAMLEEYAIPFLEQSEAVAEAVASKKEAANKAAEKSE